MVSVGRTARQHSRPERLGSWLATTARRSASDSSNGRRGRCRASPSTSNQASSSSTDISLESERDAELWRAFAELDEDSQQLLRLLLADPPFSYDEIAEILDMKRGSIGPTRQRCLDSLRPS